MYLDKFEKFLESVNLEAYRQKYRPIKIVEMDLPKNIQAISMLYKVYWDDKRFIDYEDFYKEYLFQYKKDIESFREKTTMCKNCFYRGLPARIYRTWASIITQIHAGYVAEYVFGDGTVSMSAELDHQGADFQVKYKGKILNYQVKKKSFSREVRQPKKVKNKLEGEFIEIFYEVPNYERIKNPYKRNGKDFYSDYKVFKEKFLDTGYLKVLENGFVVFTPQAFIKTKERIDKGLK